MAHMYMRANGLIRSKCYFVNIAGIIIGMDLLTQTPQRLRPIWLRKGYQFRKEMKKVGYPDFDRHGQPPATDRFFLSDPIQLSKNVQNLLWLASPIPPAEQADSHVHNLSSAPTPDAPHTAFPAGRKMPGTGGTRA